MSFESFERQSRDSVKDWLDDFEEPAGIRNQAAEVVRGAEQQSRDFVKDLQRDFEQLVGIRNQAAELVRGAETLERVVRRGAPTEEDFDAALALLPEGEVKDAATRFRTAYSSFQRFNNAEDDYERVSIAVDGVLEVLDLEEDPNAKTVATALNVGLSLASGNYVSA